MYDRFYNLTKKPFQLTADPDFFFNSAIHKRAISYMHYGLTQGEGFVVITGKPGTGKTMLVKELVKKLNKENLLIGVMVTSQVGPEDTLRIVSSTFGCQHLGQDKANLLSGLERFILEKAGQGKRLLLIIDEAHNLPKQSLEELRILSNIEINGISVFQVFLIGQNELRHSIYAPNMEQLKQRVISSFQLYPLGAEETKAYILFRLQKAGWRQKPEFSDDVFRKIHEFTQGVPRKINTFCDRLLLYGYLEELALIGIEAVEKVWGEISDEMMLKDGGNEAKPEDERDLDRTASGSYEERIASLEKQIVHLKGIVAKEKALLRKAILIQLDMDDVYSSYEAPNSNLIDHLD
jgi:putative secretion ATPase (PEP-CTERM system associated)